MKNILGNLLWLLAIAITIVVVLSKYNIYQTPTVSGMLMRDPALSLLIAIVLSLISKWV